MNDFQTRVNRWMLNCFGPLITNDYSERNHRFLEEALELVQSCNCTISEAHQLVDYVFNRPSGEPRQECGGVMVTLAALCMANSLNMELCGDVELDRINQIGVIEKIRAKQAAKPKHSPLPQAPAWEEPTDAMWGGLARDIAKFMTSGGPHYGSRLYRHLRALGTEIPEWLLNEIADVDHTPPMGTFAVCIYRAMQEAREVMPSRAELKDAAHESKIAVLMQQTGEMTFIANVEMAVELSRRGLPPTLIHKISYEGPWNDSAAMESGLREIQMQGDIDEANAAKTRAHTMLRNMATELEEGKDALIVADNIREALGEGRPNNTEDEE